MGTPFVLLTTPHEKCNDKIYHPPQIHLCDVLASSQASFFSQEFYRIGWITHTVRGDIIRSDYTKGRVKQVCDLNRDPLDEANYCPELEKTDFFDELEDHMSGSQSPTGAPPVFMIDCHSFWTGHTGWDGQEIVFLVLPWMMQFTQTLIKRVSGILRNVKMIVFSVPYQTNVNFIIHRGYRKGIPSFLMEMNEQLLINKNIRPAPGKVFPLNSRGQSLCATIVKVVKELLQEGQN